MTASMVIMSLGLRGVVLMSSRTMMGTFVIPSVSASVVVKAMIG